MKSKGVTLLLALLIIVAGVAGASAVLAQPQKPGLSLRLVSSSYPNQVIPGADNAFQMAISNTRLGTVSNIRLYSYQPKGWEVKLTPQAINLIGENSIQTVDINVRPPADADRGYYNITITAEAVETTGILDISVQVERATSIWLWIGVALAAVVIAGFVFVFVRSGRQ